MKSNAKPSRCPWSLFSAVLLTLAAFSVPMHGQEAANTVGYSEDWSSHHVVFSNPGTEADAVQSGKYGEWLKITGEPRYQMQQAKRNAPAVQPTLVAPASNRLNFGRSGSGQLSPIENGGIRRIGGRPVAGPEFGKGRLGVTIDKDWSMSIGTIPDASLTISVSNAPGSLTVSAGSTITVEGNVFTTAAPAAASRTGTFSANPGNGQTLAITNGANSTPSLTASYGTAGTQTGSFGSVPTEETKNAGDSITIVDGANTLSVTTNATGATLGGTWTNDPTTTQTAPTVTISGVVTTLSVASGAQTPAATAAFSGVPTATQTVAIPSGIQTLTLTAAAPTGSTNGTIQLNTITPAAGGDTLTLTTAGFGTVTYTFSTSACGTTANCIYAPSSGNNITNMAANIRAAINASSVECGDTTGGACFGSNTVVNPYVVAAASTACGTGLADRCISLTNDSYQAVTLGKTGTSGDFTLTSPTAPTNTGCTTATAGNFIIGTGALGSAENLYGAINACNTSFSVIGITASTFTAGTDSFTIGETVYGALESSFTEGLSNFTLTSTQAGNLGTANSCSGNTASYKAANTAAGLMANVVAALQACPAATGNAYALTGAGAAFTVYNNQLGTLSTTISAHAAGTPSLVTWGSAANGSTGSNTCGSTTAATFQVLSTDTTTTLVATELAAALNACSAANDGTIGITTGGTSVAHSTNSVTVTANKWAANSGVTLGATASGPFSWTASTISGVDGNNTAPNFAVDNILADDATNLRADINTYSGTVGVAASGTGATVTITASVPGTGGNGVTLSNGLTNITLTSPLAGGTNGPGDTATTFNYWSGSTYDTQGQLATDLATAFNTAGALANVVSAAANTGATPPTVVLTAFQGGTTGNGYTAATGTGTHTFTALTIGNGGDFAGGVDSTINPNTYPAKYSFSTTTASCSDLVVYSTGIGGSQATIVGYNSLYKTTCGSPTSLPNVAFAYNTPDISSNPGTAGLSPIFSLDGSQIAYVESVGTAATLVLLKPSATSGGTVALPASITYESLSNYRNCVAPCYTTIAFSGGANDTNSSPYYDYNTAGGDILWVGDDAGKLHEFTGVFNGTSPAENLSNWPVTVDSGTKLSSPVWDSISGNVFVTDSVGKLSKVTTPGTPVVTNSAAIPAGGAPLNDAPILDEMPASPLLYVTMGDCCNGTAHTDVGVERFTEALTADGYDYVTGGGGSTTLTTYAGSFDNIHYDIAGGAGGFFVVCLPNGGTPGLYHLPLASGWSTSGTTVTVSDTIGTAATCSPVTEFLGAKANTTLSAAMTNAQTTVSVGSTAGMAVGDYIQIDSEIMHITTLANPLTVTRGQQGTAAVAHNTVGDAVQDIQDWAYLSVSAGGGDAGCSGACLYNYNITTTTAPTNATTGIATTGGASAVIVDNALTTTGESQIYFSSQGNEACAGNGTTGDSTGATCAVQASQPALQ